MKTKTLIKKVNRLGKEIYENGFKEIKESNIDKEYRELKELTVDDIDYALLIGRIKGRIELERNKN